MAMMAGPQPERHITVSARWAATGCEFAQLRVPNTLKVSAVGTELAQHAGKKGAVLRLLVAGQLLAAQSSLADVVAEGESLTVDVIREPLDEAVPLYHFPDLPPDVELHRNNKAFPLVIASNPYMLGRRVTTYIQPPSGQLLDWINERAYDAETEYHLRRFDPGTITPGLCDLHPEVSRPTLKALDRDEAYQSQRRSVDFAVLAAATREQRLSELVSEGSELCKGSLPKGDRPVDARFSLDHRQDLARLRHPWWMP